MNPYRLLELLLLPIAWAALILAALQTKNFFSATSHSICGPWGCGPETGALVAMHAGWLAAVGPPLLYLPVRLRFTPTTLRWLSFGLALFGFGGLAAIVAWQWLVWLPQAAEWSQGYIWQRCGFVIATTVDYPLVPAIITATILRLRTVRSQTEP